MVKSLMTIAMLVATTSMAQASYVCGVSAENPQQPGVYDQLLKVYTGDLQEGQAVVLYDNVAAMVTAMKTQGGSLQLASFQKGTKKIDSAAFAKTDSIGLIDGKNNWSIICQQK